MFGQLPPFFPHFKGSEKAAEFGVLNSLNSKQKIYCIALSRRWLAVPVFHQLQTKQNKWRKGDESRGRVMMAARRGGGDMRGKSDLPCCCSRFRRVLQFIICSGLISNKYPHTYFYLLEQMNKWAIFQLKLQLMIIFMIYLSADYLLN